MPGTIPILMFHAIDDRREAISFPPDRFEQALKRLDDRGYKTARLADAAEKVRRGESLPERSVVLTFDDGYRSVYEHAFPLLARHGMTATVFAIARSGGSFADRPLMEWRQMKEMREAGFEIGAHTINHPDLTRISPREMSEEIAGSKSRIEDALGSAVTSFAYPFGRHNRASVECARENFACACTARLSLASSRSDPLRLQRVDAFYLLRPRAFELIFSRWFPMYLRARALPRRIRGLAVRCLGSRGSPSPRLDIAAGAA